MDPKSIAMPVNTSEEEGEDLLRKFKRAKFSVPIVQPHLGVEVPDILLHKVSAVKDPMNKIDSAVQSTGNTNGCMKGHANGTFSPGDGSARSRLQKICRPSGWNEPLYDFEEQGPPHNKLFSCKATIHVDGISNSVVECFGGPKSQKKAAQEHAARGALWCLVHFGHVK